MEQEIIQVEKVEKKANFFLKRIRKHQVLTFTLSFLFFYRFIGTLIFYFASKETFIKNYGLSIGIFLIIIPAVYFLQWLIATWIASKYTQESLKDKFYRHPIASIILFISYLTDLPYRLSESDLGGGFFKIINAFEIIIYYAFISFLWWMLVCWISKMVWRKQKFEWSWYKKIIDKIFVFLPPIYKLILGLIVALLIFLLLLVLFVGVFHYSGSDLKKL